MSLLFNAAGEFVDHGSSSELNTLTTATCCMWIYPTSLPASLIVIGSKNGTSGIIILPSDSSGAGRMRIRVRSDATPLSYTGSTNDVVTDSWQFAAWAWDTSASAGNQASLYVGDLTTAPTEVTYTTQQDMTGTQSSDATANWLFGEESGFEYTGRIDRVALWDRELSLGEIRQQWYGMHKTSGCVLLSVYGYNGTGSQPDYSGNFNPGTVTNATQDIPAPVPSIWKGSSGWQGAFTAAAVGGRTTRNTDPRPLGVNAGMSRWMPQHYGG